MTQINSPEPMPLDDFDPDPPRWPKVIGWIHVSLGAFGISCLACGVVGIAAGPTMVEGVPGVDMNNLPPNMHPSALQIAQMALGGLLAVVQIITGVMTLNRHASARLLNLVWSPLTILVGVLGIFVQISVMKATEAWMAANADSPLAQGGGGSGGGIQYALMACGVLLGIGWPVFCILWFGLIKKRPEQMLHRDTPASV
jgi:hypothetical protein